MVREIALVVFMPSRKRVHWGGPLCAVCPKKHVHQTLVATPYSKQKNHTDDGCDATVHIEAMHRTTVNGHSPVGCC